ncbi:MAG: HxsD-like protein [Nannocystaceae bacterium]
MSVQQLSFHKTVYSGESLDEATKAFANFASFELTQADDAWVVALTPNNPDLGDRLRNEFCNYALGLTIQRGGAS